MGVLRLINFMYKIIFSNYGKITKYYRKNKRKAS